ncbi:MAG TPA: type II CAAX endopeptidase family protein [Longimicrobiaceae bacterium]|nr:type II CAAX endopeptidase family protein [Longimicrobiaceae bacterium]
MRNPSWNLREGDVVLLFQTLALLVAAILWTGIGLAFIAFPLPLAIAWLLVLFAAFLWLAVRRGKGRRRARGLATLRLRAPGRAALPLFFAGLATGVFGLSTIVLGTHAGLLHPSDSPDIFDGYWTRPGGWLPVGFMMLVFAPVSEEFFFRGWMQRPIERRFGPAIAIAVTTILFVLAHGEPTAIATEAVGGLVMGFAVVATRSIWSAVLLHSGNNFFAFTLSLLFGSRFDSADAVYRDLGPWPLLAMAVLSSVAIVGILMYLRRFRSAHSRTEHLTLPPLADSGAVAASQG